VVNDELIRLREGAEALGCPLSEQQAHALVRYLNELETTNRSFNLTRIPRAEYVTLHLLDSLAAQHALKASPGMKILDIGTGAGFPGVPLAAANPSAQVTLLDSTAKKVMWAAATADACGITNCRALHARAEALAQSPQYRGKYDVVISRAVASFDALIQLMLPLVARGGRAIALKGAKAQEELKGTDKIVAKLGGSSAQLLSVRVPGSDVARYLIVVEKQR
jgi:16S rRNA (guanine527-N7)-methyltransferase